MQNKERQASLDRATPASIFYGTVINVDPATYNVEIAPTTTTQAQVLQGVLLAPALCSSLGIKTSNLPPVGAQVLCVGVSASKCIVVGCIPDSDATGVVSNLTQRVSIGGGSSLANEIHRQNYGTGIGKLTTHNLQRPTDVSSREYVLSNEYGVIFALLQQMVTLKASELAQVQCFVLDDLVRIISHNYEHLTCMGTTKITHDGVHLNLEAGYTHSAKESIGIHEAVEPGEPVITETGKQSFDDKAKLFDVDESLREIERLKVFVGQLGDFVNLMMVLPSKFKSTGGNAPAQPDRGLAQFKMGLDGLFVMRSLKGVVLEKTNWIRVPSRIKSPEDPNGDKDVELEPREDFLFDDAYQENGQPYLYYLQLRDYLAYMNEDFGYSGFKKQEKDFYVNDSYAAEKLLDDTTYIDPVTGTAYKKKTSSIVLMPNGGISMMDAWGSAIVMEGGDIRIQPAKDYIVQPMGNYIAKVGDKVSIAARRDVDISTTTGGFRLKTDKSIYAYSESSGIILHGDGKLGADNVLPEGLAVEHNNGVVIKAPNSGIYTSAKWNVNQFDERSWTKAKYVTVQAEELLDLLSDRHAEMFTKGAMIFSSKQNIEMFATTSLLALGDAGTVIGKQGQTLGLVVFGDTRIPVEGILDEDDGQASTFEHLRDTVTRLDELDVSEQVAGFKSKEEFDEVIFRFLGSDSYNLGDNFAFPQTIAQQENDTQGGIHSLSLWEETPVNDTYPFPGADAAECFVTSAMMNLEYTNEWINKVLAEQKNGLLTDPVNLFTNYRSK